MHLSRLTNRLLAAVAVLGAAVGASLSDHAQAVINQPTLQELTQRADVIYIAKCRKREVVVRGGNIVTRYEFDAEEYWKGGPRLSGADSGGTIRLDQYGGAIDYPVPIVQMSPISVNFAEGQEVLLFTRKPEPREGQVALAGAGEEREPLIPRDQPRLVGGPMGVFSIVRDPESGRKLVAPGTVAGRIEQGKAPQGAARRAQQQAERGQAQLAETSAEAREGESEDRIQPYESLSDVRMRVQAYLEQAKEEQEP